MTTTLEPKAAKYAKASVLPTSATSRPRGVPDRFRARLRVPVPPPSCRGRRQPSGHRPDPDARVSTTTCGELQLEQGGGVQQGCRQRFLDHDPSVGLEDRADHPSLKPGRGAATQQQRREPSEMVAHPARFDRQFFRRHCRGPRLAPARPDRPAVVTGCGRRACPSPSLAAYHLPSRHHVSYSAMRSRQQVTQVGSRCRGCGAGRRLGLPGTGHRRGRRPLSSSPRARAGGPHHVPVLSATRTGLTQPGQLRFDPVGVGECPAQRRFTERADGTLAGPVGREAP